jgi:hypothetical protein
LDQGNHGDPPNAICTGKRYAPREIGVFDYAPLFFPDLVGRSKPIFVAVSFTIDARLMEPVKVPSHEVAPSETP